MYKQSFRKKGENDTKVAFEKILMTEKFLVLMRKQLIDLRSSVYFQQYK